MPWGDDEVNEVNDEVNDEVKKFQGMMKKTFSVARVFFCLCNIFLSIKYFYSIELRDFFVIFENLFDYSFIFT